MSDRSTTYKGVKQLVIVLLLLALLAALVLAYYFLTRPAALQGQGERDRKFMFSIYGFEGDLLRRPTSVGTDGDGNIYVADTGKRRIVVFDEDGNFLFLYGEAGKEPLKLWIPVDVAVGPDGTSYVVDRGQSKIVIYDPAHQPVREIEVEEPPIGVTVEGENLFVTTDSGVIISDLEGNALMGYISRGKEPGEFDRPGAVAVGNDGTLFVCDTLNYRVQAIGTDGKPKWVYGAPIPSDKAIQYDSESRKFGLPSSITIDDNGLLYVVDGLNHEVVVLASADGEFIERIGDQGHADGTFYHPDGIEYSDGRIIVADKFNDRVSVFRVPLPPGQAWRSYVPYALPLLLLPLLLLFLLRRRKYVVTPDFLDALQSDPNADLVVAAIKRVHGTETVVSAGEAMGVDLRWVKHDADVERVRETVERFDLEPAYAEAVAVSLAMRGRRLLITEDAATRAAADTLGVPVVTYSEIRTVLGADEKPESEGEVA